MLAERHRDIPTATVLQVLLLRLAGAETRRLRHSLVHPKSPSTAIQASALLADTGHIQCLNVLLEAGYGAVSVKLSLTQPGCLQTGFLEIAELDDRGMFEPEKCSPRAFRMCPADSAKRKLFLSRVSSPVTYEAYLYVYIYICNFIYIYIYIYIYI